MDLALTDNGELISCSYDSTIIIWEKETFNCSRILAGHLSGIERIKIFNQEIIISLSDNEIKIWNFKLGTCIKSLNDVFSHYPSHCLEFF